MFSHMKTIVELPDDLLIRAKKRAVETGTPLRKLIARGLRRELASSSIRARSRRSLRKIEWIVAPGGLPPGAEVSDRAALHDWIRSGR
jgi:hypothetical protein